MMEIAAAAIIILLPFDWVTAVILAWVSHQHPAILTLRERSVTAWIIALAGTIAAVLATVQFGVVSMRTQDALVLVALALVLMSLPSLLWLTMLVRGRFDIGERS